MKKFLLALTVLSATQFALADARPGIVLRLQSKSVIGGFKVKMPEVRVLSTGQVFAGMVDRNGVGNLNQIDRLSRGEMNEVQAQIEEASYGEIRRWISGAFCFRAPDYQEVFTARNGSVFLRNGNICLGGGRENTSSAARELVALLSGYAQQIERQ